MKREAAIEFVRGMLMNVRNGSTLDAEQRGWRERIGLYAVLDTQTQPEQFAAVRTALQEMGEATPDQIARRFQRLRQASVQPLLESLTLLGQARIMEGGRFAI